MNGDVGRGLFIIFAGALTPLHPYRGISSPGPPNKEGDFIRVFRRRIIYWRSMVGPEGGLSNDFARSDAFAYFVITSMYIFISKNRISPHPVSRPTPSPALPLERGRVSCVEAVLAGTSPAPTRRGGAGRMLVRACGWIEGIWQCPHAGAWGERCEGKRGDESGKEVRLGRDYRSRWRERSCQVRKAASNWLESDILDVPHFRSAK